MRLILLIALGGAVGALARFFVTKYAAYFLGPNFPYGTLLVNVSGSFLIGFLVVLLFEKLLLSTEWRALLITGFLGGFTTFSAFAYETINLFERGALFSAGLNIILNVILCLVAVITGMILARI